MPVKSFNNLATASIKSINGLTGPSIKSINGVEFILKGFTVEFTVAGDAAARTVTLPLVQNRAEGALSYNCVVDWGDGTAPSLVTTFNDANRIHTYAGDGTYEVEITGTMEGWSFDNGGDKLKITDIINWGSTTLFDGFKYLRKGFYGCTNLATLGGGEPIPASGTGLLTDGFYYTFRNCSGLTSSIPSTLFSLHTAVTTNAFRGVFLGCSGLTGSIPSTLFASAPLASSLGLYQALKGCSGLTGSIPSGLFDNNTLLSGHGVSQIFESCSGLTGSIPAGLFDNLTLLVGEGLASTFTNCSGLTGSIPPGLFDNNTEVTRMTRTFRGCAGLTGAIPPGLFDNNTKVTSFSQFFHTCSGLTSTPANLFRNNILCLTFSYVFSGCNKLQQHSDIFYAAGEQASRFLDQAVNFTQCFLRGGFSGTQGTAPDLWECDFGEEITIDVSPATDWDPADIITGQTSGAVCEVVSKTDATHYKIKKKVGTYTLGEIIGVTGVPAKLADQGAAHPTFAGGPNMTDCWDGAGNSAASLDNYGDIPADWI